MICVSPVLSKQRCIQRIVVDRQVCIASLQWSKPKYLQLSQTSSGIIHAGYPVVANVDLLPFLLDVASLRADGCWPIFHELVRAFILLYLYSI